MLLVATVYLKKRSLTPLSLTVNYVLLKASGDEMFRVQKVAGLGSVPVGNAA